MDLGVSTMQLLSPERVIFLFLFIINCILLREIIIKINYNSNIKI